MSHFYGSIKGNRGPATRGGSKNSGIVSHTKGWNSGIRVTGYVNDNGDDEFKVEITNGSRLMVRTKLIGTFTVNDFIIREK